MLPTAGNVGDVIKVLDMAGVEMLAISLPDSRIVDVTRALAESWKCSKYEAVGQQLSQSPDSPYYAHYVETDLTTLDGKPKLQVEIAKALDGGVRFVRRFKPQMHKDGDKDFLLLIGSTTDVAEAVESDDTLAQLELAVKAGGYASWTLDFQTYTATFAPELNHMLGFDPETNPLTYNRWISQIHPEDRQATLDALVVDGESASEIVHATYRIADRDGKYLWVELIGRVAIDPINREKTRMIGLCRDVSAQMKKLSKTETSEQNLARSQALAQIGSWVLDLTDETLDWSDHMFALAGISKTDSGHGDFQVLVDGMDDDNRAKWEESISFARKGQAVAGLQCAFTTPLGDNKLIAVHIDIEFDSDGQPAKLHGICQDITDQNLMERKFLQAQKMESVGQLTGGIAHDFNNLLMVVLGNLQLLEKLTANDDKAAERLTTAIDAVNKGSELTKRLLAFSRKQTVEDEKIAVNDLIANVEDMLVRAINSTIELKIKPGENIWSVRADKTQLETAILNLSINARDAMPEGGKLIVETENRTIDTAVSKHQSDVRPGDYVVISVSDTGHGMPEDIKDKVLEPFFSTKPAGSGSGLGLAMIYGFVKQAKGHLNIYSEEDVGTTIRIYLPRDKADCAAVPVEGNVDNPALDETIDVTAAQEIVPDEVVVAEDTPAPIVLIAEDNDPVRDVAVAMIEELGYTVLDAANGEAALEIIRERDDIDLLLSDVVMPGMNGPELAAAALEIRPDLKVLFASGYTQGTAEEMHELPNFIELIDKPFTQEDLTSKVKAAVEQQRKSKAA